MMMMTTAWYLVNCLVIEGRLQTTADGKSTYSVSQQSHLDGIFSHLVTGVTNCNSIASFKVAGLASVTVVIVATVICYTWEL